MGASCVEEAEPHHLLSEKEEPEISEKTHKFVIEVLTTVAEALEIDKKNGDTHWSDGLASEMNIRIVYFDVLPDGQNAPIGNQFVKCHIIFVVKMEDFHQKA